MASITRCCNVRDMAGCPTQPPCARLQIDLIQGMMDCLYAQCIPCITDCVMAELEKLGTKYRVALKVAKVGHPSPPACLAGTLRHPKEAFV